MSQFSGPAGAYQRFMGRFSSLLSAPFADLALEGVPAGSRVLDVGAGPGVLTGELVRRLGQAAVSAVEPEGAFAEATATAYPQVDVRRGFAEELPHEDAAFGATMAQLVVHFMRDPRAGVAEMARVTAPGGRVSGCVWDHAGGGGPLRDFWRVARALDPAAPGQARQVGATRGDLTRLLADAGLSGVVEVPLTVHVRFADFEEWWSPFTLGLGPAGRYAVSLSPQERSRLEDALRAEIGSGALEVSATAWAATGVVTRGRA